MVTRWGILSRRLIPLVRPTVVPPVSIVISIRCYSGKNLQEQFEKLNMNDHTSSPTVAEQPISDISANNSENVNTESVAVSEDSTNHLDLSETVSELTEESTETKPNSNDNLKRKLREEQAIYMKNLPEWAKRDKAVKKRYGQWNPTKKLTRQQIEYLRTTADLMPHLRTIDLASMYNVSPEAIRRILKSKWVPNDDEVDKVIQREEKRRLQKAERYQPNPSSKKVTNFHFNQKERPRSRPQSKHSRKLKRTVNRSNLSIDEMID